MLNRLLLDWWNEVCRRLGIAMAEADAWLRGQAIGTESSIAWGAGAIAILAVSSCYAGLGSMERGNGS